MERVYFGVLEVDTVDVNFLLESAEEITSIEITEGTEETTSITDGVFELQLDDTASYTAEDIELLIIDDEDIVAATVEGQEDEVSSTEWAGTFDVSEGKEAQWAFGTRLYKEKDNGNYERVLKVQNFGGPSFSLDTEDTTDNDSPGGWEEIIPTILRSGEVSMDVSFLPGLSNHVNLLRDMINKKRRKFKLVFPDDDRTTWGFRAYVTGWDMDLPYDSKADASVTVKITGEPELDAESVV